MDKPINEILIQFSGKACMPKEVVEDCVLRVHGSVISETFTDNQDGTCNKIQRVKIISVETL